MKKYSSRKAHHGRLAYRTPERFIYRKYQEVTKLKSKSRKKKFANTDKE